MSIPVRRKQFDLRAFAAYLSANGAEIGIPTNSYEVIRYRAFWKGSAKAVTHIVYTKENGLLTYMAGSRDHYASFLREEALAVEAEAIRKVRRPKRTAALREKLRKRDGDCCWFCGGLLEAAESNIEHLIPISEGGTNALANLVMAHTACNTKAGSMTLAKKLELRSLLRSSEPVA